jgi:hypothetical protein
MGRTAKWTPRVLTPSEIIAGACVLSKYGPDLKLETRIKGEYKQFCLLNRLSRQEGYEPWIGQMKASELSAGTIKNYMDIASRGDKSTSAYRARKACECMQADSKTSHAADITLREANNLINAAKKVPNGAAQAEQLWKKKKSSGRVLLIAGKKRGGQRQSFFFFWRFAFRRFRDATPRRVFEIRSLFPNDATSLSRM